MRRKHNDTFDISGARARNVAPLQPPEIFYGLACVKGGKEHGTDRPRRVRVDRLHLLLRRVAAEGYRKQVAQLGPEGFRCGEKRVRSRRERGTPGKLIARREGN